jgi:thiol-disulfide isomerase/thioredoxin
VKERRDRVGLIFFASPGCPACQKQAPLLWYFHKNTGIDVEPVSATACMEEWPDCTISPDAFKQYGVERTPTLMMVYRSDPSPDAPYVTQIVSNGVISVTGLMDRMATFMRYWDSGKFMDAVDLGESYLPGRGFVEPDVSEQREWLIPENEQSPGPGFAGPAFR